VRVFVSLRNYDVNVEEREPDPVEMMLS
jgi:hypothetical protein